MWLVGGNAIEAKPIAQPADVALIFSFISFMGQTSASPHCDHQGRR